MKKAIERLEAFDEKKKCINAIVETPKCSRVKYAYSPEDGLFRLKRAMPEGMAFPFNYGFIPSTLGKDGDPLDIVVLNEEAVISGCLLKIRLLAVIEAEQTEDGKMVRNDKLIGTAIDEETPPEFLSVKLDKGRLNQIIFFFSAYNKINGKKFKALNTKGPKQAEKLIRAGMKLFKKNKEKE
jgi:inorganic pyrophosphatase